MAISWYRQITLEDVRVDCPDCPVVISKDSMRHSDSVHGANGYDIEFYEDDLPANRFLRQIAIWWRTIRRKPLFNENAPKLKWETDTDENVVVYVDLSRKKDTTFYMGY